MCGGAWALAFALEMGWVKETRRQLRPARQALLKAPGMTEPYLPLALFCLNRKTAGINLGLSDSLAAEATRSPFDRNLAFRRIG
jgi:hypothetical protein